MGSNALAFKQWAKSEQLLVTAGIEQLKGCKIAVDAEIYALGRFTSKTGEPLLPALGGLPFAFRSRIDSDIQGLREASIFPVFVFNGLDLACKDRASILNESRKASRILEQAWKDYDDSKGEQAVDTFGRACSYRMQPIMRGLHTYLVQLGVPVQVAPYSAAAQMAAYERVNFVDAVVGSASCFAFGSDKVITNVDWENACFHWIDIKACLVKTMLNREQFVELCLLSGSSILPTLPEIDGDSPISKMQAARTAMSRAGNNASNVVLKDEAYQTLFHKARFAVKFPVAIADDGKVEPRGWEKGPSDAHEFIGQRLPLEIYHYLSSGLIGPRVLNWRTRMEIVETPPLDGGNSQVYRELVEDKLMPIRAQALAIITHSIHRYYQNTDVGLVCWYNEAEKKNLNIRDITSPTKSADSWHVQLNGLETGSAKIDAGLLSFTINVLSDETVASKTVTPRSSNQKIQLEGLNELRANITWRVLADRGYIDTDHKLTSRGKALKTALDTAKQIGLGGDEHDEIIFLALELVRLGLLDTKQLFTNPPYSGAPIRGSDADKANATLISRLACLASLKHDEIGYTGPLSRSLLAYGQLAAGVRGALRDLTEMHACHLFVSGATDRDIRVVEYAKLGAGLPFAKEPDVGLAIVVKSYLDELSNENGRQQDISKWFNHALDVGKDLQTVWKLWDAVVAGVQAADDKSIAKETKSMFASADEWLKKKLQAADDTKSAV